MNTKSWKYIEIPLFLVLFGWIFVHLTYCARDGLSHTRANFTGFYAEKDNTIDVAVVGTSSTFSSVIPIELWGEFGIPAYDLCNNVLFENSIPYLLRELKKTQDPKLVIIDIAPFMYGHYPEKFTDDDSQVRYNIDGYKLSKNRIDLINAILPDREKLYYYLDFLYYHNNKLSFEYWNWEKHSIYKGYNNLEIKKSFDRDSEIGLIEESFEMPETELKYLDDALKAVDNMGCSVLFMAEPYFRSDDKLDASKRVDWIEAYLSSKGYDFLNLQKHKDEIGIDPETDYSLDYNHFHIESAEKITRFLGTYISENYGLEAKNELPQYSSWNDDYDEWMRTLRDEEYQKLADRRKAFLEQTTP